MIAPRSTLFVEVVLIVLVIVAVAIALGPQLERIGRQLLADYRRLAAGARARRRPSRVVDRIRAWLP